MPQPRKGYHGSSFGTVYTSIIKSAHRIDSRNPQSTAQLSEESKAKQRMVIKSPHHHHTPTTSASLSPDAVFYNHTTSNTPPRRSSSEGSEDESRDHHSGSIRKRDKVKMVSLHLHNAFKSWFKDVSVADRIPSS